MVGVVPGEFCRQLSFKHTRAQNRPTLLSFIGSLSIALCVVLGLASQLIGARYSVLLGVIMMSFGSLFSSLTVNNLVGLFATAGVSL